MAGGSRHDGMVRLEVEDCYAGRVDRDAGLAATELSPGERTATHATTPDQVPSGVGKPPRMLGRYQLEQELGVGGMGIVHAALDPELERRVAIKLILRATSDDARTRLLREARAMARLTHPNIITIYEIGSQDGRDFVAMELIDGGSLADWLRAERRPSVREILEAFLAAGRGLAAAHEAGIVHRDFKPHNVLRSSSGRIVVGDFGLATGLDTQVASADIPLAAYTTLTATGSWVGTPAYMAPEQWNGGSITPATDQFAFCVALWEALAGERPFRGDTVEQLRAAVTGGPDKLDMSAIPRRLRPVLRRGLDPDPAKRWPEMSSLLAALQPDRRKLYVGLAALGGLGLSASVVVLALTRTAAPERPSTPPEIQRQAERTLAETKARIAKELAAEDLRNLERARRLSTVLGDRDVVGDLRGQIKRISGGKVSVPQAVIGKLVEELTGGQAVRLVPSISNGEFVGWKLYTMKASTLLAAIGIANGDVLVAIDGRPLTEQNLAATLARLSGAAKVVRLDLRSDGRAHTIELVIEKPDPWLVIEPDVESALDGSEFQILFAPEPPPPPAPPEPQD